MDVAEFFAYLLSDERSRDLAIELCDAYSVRAVAETAAAAG